MPLSSEYTWSETTETVTISVPLKGVSHKTVDILTLNNILKVNYKPYLLDLNLFQDIVEDKSRAVFKDEVLSIRLTKKESQLWGQLCFIGSKSEIAARRENSMKLRDERTEQQKEMAAARKVDEERMMLREHMALEEKERQRMDNIKHREKMTAEDEMFDTFSTLREVKKDLVIDDNVYLPPPIRESVQLSFRHTPRLFKTPLRQSTKKREEEFIIKNRSKLRDNALLVDTDVSNVDPFGSLLKATNFTSAETLALNADGRMVETLLARAACYLDLREADPCIADCMAALKLSDSIETRFETDEARLLFQKKLLTTLGMAYCMKTEHDKALELFHSVLQLDKNDHDAPRNIRYLETLMEVADLKAKADKNFSMGSLEEAKENYSKAEKLDPGHIQVLMNPKSDSSACALANILHPTPCTKRKWQVILLCRRSAAKRLSNDLRGALADLELAKGITSNDDDVAVKSIAKDIDDLKAKLTLSRLKIPSDS
ncbi:hypothetical protein QTG54_004162 [Skeletonema marinoi]|uniref:Dynein axonemal assembly factor 4 n=1 Tax=Skeletonema marinoi TaxID=267567 RepID=A0AAD8YGR9_9STRA|nr:hypothetical protein QTG54_004162 [Skeletonema marinoi]